MYATQEEGDCLATEAALPQIPSEWLDQVVTGPMSAEAVENVMRGFKKAVIECALGAEMSHHLGYRPGTAKPERLSNHRNGTSGKTVLTDGGPLRIDLPVTRLPLPVEKSVPAGRRLMPSSMQLCPIDGRHDGNNHLSD